MSYDERKFSALSERIIGCAFTVSNALGMGFLEKVYERALVHEMQKQGLAIRRQHPVVVKYDGIVVGDYALDVLVEESIIVELKHVKAFDDVHIAQCLNYLRAANLHLCLLLNFGKPRIDVRRVLWRGTE
jgi:GxxExxY protein